MERNKRLVVLLLSLLFIMTLAVCFIGYSLYQVYDQLDSIRYGLNSIDFELHYISDGLDSIDNSLWKVYSVLRDILFEL